MTSSYEPLLVPEANDEPPESASKRTGTRTVRVASVDVFRGLSVFLMTLVDYAGSIFPFIAHSPWDGLNLADFVMPFFLFIAGVSLALAYKQVPNKGEATCKAVLRALKLFFLGVLLQGGYLHGITSLTYGVDIERIRLLGILQRIAIGYIVAALCEIWLPHQTRIGNVFSGSYFWHWCMAFLLSAMYLALLYGLYVPDWQFKVVDLTSYNCLPNSSYIYNVACSVRGDLGPGCNSAGMIDRYAIGINHMYAKPVYRNLQECNISNHGQVSDSSPSWCHAPFEPEGILSSFTAAVTSIIGLQYGHILTQVQDHKERLYRWFILSFSFLVLGLLLVLIGMPVNKSLSTVSYMLLTLASAGIVFCILYTLVDVYGCRRLTFVLEWMGKHSLIVFIIVTSNIAVIAIQGFYWKSPPNNIVRWIVTRFVNK